MHPDLIFTLIPIMQNLGIGTGHKHRRFDLVWFCSNTVPGKGGHDAAATCDIGDTAKRTFVNVQGGFSRIPPTAVKGGMAVIFTVLAKGLHNGHRWGVYWLQWELFNFREQSVFSESIWNLAINQSSETFGVSIKLLYHLLNGQLVEKKSASAGH